MDEETARGYVENWGDDVSNSMTVELANLTGDDVVLDIGCGSGTAAREAAALVTEGRVIGIDPSPAMLRIAAEQTVSGPGGDRIEYRVGSAESIPLEDGTVAVAMAINTIHHWADLSQGLADALCVLAPGGRLLITEELLASGKFGHGEGPSSDPGHIAEAMSKVGFVRVTSGTHERGDNAILTISAHSPTGQ